MLTATISTVCGVVATRSKTIFTGVANANLLKIYSDGPTVCPNLPIDFGAFYAELDACTIAATGATNIEWSVSPTPLQIINNSGNGVCPGVNNSGIEIKFASMPYSYNSIVRFRTQNACGWSNWSNDYIVNVRSSSMCGGYMYSVFPNPTTDVATIQPQENITQSLPVLKIRIFDQVGVFRKEWSFGQGNKKVQINTTGLSPGTYTIEVVNSQNKSERHQLLIK